MDKNAEILQVEITERDRRFMALAAKIAEENIDRGGGPFGAVIVGRDGNVVAKGSNTVTLANDPTAHAEVNAIREACAALKTFNLAGCTVYSSCEPCPMCLSALYWAGVCRIFFGNTKEDAEAINFSDSFIYRELEKPRGKRALPCVRIENAETIRAFEKWASKPDKTVY